MLRKKHGLEREKKIEGYLKLLEPFHKDKC